MMWSCTAMPSGLAISAIAWVIWMSARPGVFLDLVHTGWSRDRDSNIVADETFGRITARLWSTLRTESQKSLAFGQGAALK